MPYRDFLMKHLRKVPEVSTPTFGKRITEDCPSLEEKLLKNSSKTLSTVLFMMGIWIWNLLSISGTIFGTIWTLIGMSAWTLRKRPLNRANRETGIGYERFYRITGCVIKIEVRELFTEHEIDLESEALRIQEEAIIYIEDELKQGFIDDNDN